MSTKSANPSSHYSEHLDPRTVLTECCDRRTHALAISTSHAIAIGGRFARLEPSLLLLELSESTPLRPLGICCVVFNLNNRAHTFLSTVQSHEPTPYTVRLSLDIPKSITAAELRTAYRVPTDESDVNAFVATGNGQVYAARTHDISVCGVCVELPPEADLLEVGEELEVQLVLDKDLKLNLRAEVRYEKDGKYGLFFPEAVVRGEINPPPALRELVRRIELAQVRRRRGRV